MQGVVEYIMMREGGQRELLQFLHDMLMDQPGVHCKISYKVPFYSLRQRENSVPQGHQLSNVQGILEASGRSLMRCLMR